MRLWRQLEHDLRDKLLDHLVTTNADVQDVKNSVPVLDAVYPLPVLSDLLEKKSPNPWSPRTVVAEPAAAQHQQ